jgi:hypothetical protein
MMSKDQEAQMWLIYSLPLEENKLTDRRVASKADGSNAAGFLINNKNN